jgi:hypothetical protein
VRDIVAALRYLDGQIRDCFFLVSNATPPPPEDVAKLESLREQRRAWWAEFEARTPRKGGVA